jgi:hypothetical protein
MACVRRREWLNRSFHGAGGGSSLFVSLVASSSVRPREFAAACLRTWQLVEDEPSVRTACASHEVNEMFFHFGPVIILLLHCW